MRRQQVSPQTAIAFLEQVWGRDLSAYDPDGPLPDVEPDPDGDSITRGRVRHEKDTAGASPTAVARARPRPKGGLSIRELIIETTARQSFVGTPKQVAAQIDELRAGRTPPTASSSCRTSCRAGSTSSSTRWCRSCRTAASSAPSTPARRCATTSAWRRPTSAGGGRDRQSGLSGHPRHRPGRRARSRPAGHTRGVAARVLTDEQLRARCSPASSCSSALRRCRRSAAVAQVCGLQTQHAPSGYIGLWSRLGRASGGPISPAALERAEVVQGWVMRSTIHMVAARRLRPVHRRGPAGPAGAVAARPTSVPPGSTCRRSPDAVRGYLADGPLTPGRARRAAGGRRVPERACGRAPSCGSTCCGCRPPAPGRSRGRTSSRWRSTVLAAATPAPSTRRAGAARHGATCGRSGPRPPRTSRRSAGLDGHRRAAGAGALRAAAVPRRGGRRAGRRARRAAAGRRHAGAGAVPGHRGTRRCSCTRGAPQILPEALPAAGVRDVHAALGADVPRRRPGRGHLALRRWAAS